MPPGTRYRYNTLGIAAGYAGAVILAIVFGVAAWVGLLAGLWWLVALTACFAALVGYWGATLGIGIEVTEEGLWLRRLLGLGWKLVPYAGITMARERHPALPRFDRRLLVIRIRGALAFWLCSDIPPGWPRWLPGLWPIFPDYDAATAEVRARLAPLGKFHGGADF